MGHSLSGSSDLNGYLEQLVITHDNHRSLAPNPGHTHSFELPTEETVIRGGGMPGEYHLVMTGDEASVARWKKQ